jgi:hypothetical protein
MISYRAKCLFAAASCLGSDRHGFGRTHCSELSAVCRSTARFEWQRRRRSARPDAIYAELAARHHRLRYGRRFRADGWPFCSQTREPQRLQTSHGNNVLSFSQSRPFDTALAH